MKLSNRILLNVLFSTVAFSAFAGFGTDLGKRAKSFGTSVNDNKKEIGKLAGSAMAGALLMYLASNEKVKAAANKASTAISDYTKAKYQAVAAYWKNLSKSKKAVAGTAATVAAVAAYLYFEGPGAQKIKNFKKPAPSEQP